MYYYEQDGLSGLGRSFKKAVKRFNPVAATKAAISNVVKPVIKAAVTVTKKTVINPTMAVMTTASPKALLTAGRQGGVKRVLGTAISSVKPSKPGTAVTVEATVMDGPLVNIYAPNGSEGQIPNNYLTNGTFTDETGMVWSTTPLKGATAEPTATMEIPARFSPQVDRQVWTQTRERKRGGMGRGRATTAIMSAPAVSTPTVMSAPVMADPAVTAAMTAPASLTENTSSGPMAQSMGIIQQLAELMQEPSRADGGDLKGMFNATRFRQRRLFRR